MAARKTARTHSYSFCSRLGRSLTVSMNVLMAEMSSMAVNNAVPVPEGSRAKRLVHNFAVVSGALDEHCSVQTYS